jgi:hypothetical protein
MAADIFLELAFYFQVALGGLFKNCTLTFSFLTIQYGTNHMSQHHTDHGPCEIGKYETVKAPKILRISILTMVKISVGVGDPNPESVPDPQVPHVVGTPVSGSISQRCESGSGS